MKAKTITLSVNQEDLDKYPVPYRVEQVTNSLEYTPGQHLGLDQVVALVAKPAWEVALVRRRPVNSGEN